MRAADGGRVRPAGRGIVIRSVVLAFAAGVLFLAPRAFAQTVLTPNPAVLQAAQLNGASVTLQAPAGGRFGFAAALDNRWSASGAPAGVTVTVVTAAEPKLTHGRTRANLVIQATGSSTREWNLYIIGTNFAVDGSSGGVSFGPIRVQLPPPGVTLSPSAATVTRELSITEGGNATYNVQLGQQPQGSVNVQIRTPSGSEVSTNPSGLVFNTSNWNTARVVTVTARDDANVVGETVRIRHFVQDAQSSNDYDPAPDAHLTVHVTDNDTPTIRVSQQGPLRLTEGGSGTFTVALGQPPSGTVVVEVQSGDRGVVTVNGPSSGFVDIAFTPSNWNTALTVTVGAVHDGDLEDEAVSMTIGVSPADTVDEFDSAAGTSFTVQVTDDDGLRVVPRTTTVGEGSSTGATYTVALKSQPSGAVTVSVGVPSGDASAVNVAPTALTYTGGSGGNWGTAQTVTVSAGTGANDADAADRAVTLSHAVTGAAPYAYAAQAADDVTVTIEDDETAAVVLSRSAEVALREGERTTYTVRLSAPPAVGNVVVRVRSDDAAVEVNKAGGTAGASQDLTFSATTWNTGQAITVEAVEDGNAAHAAVTLTHAVVAGSSADEYDAAAAVTLAVAVTDDEGAEIAVSRGTGELALMESTGTTSATYTVRLSVQPTGPVTVGVRSDDVGAVTVGPGTLAYSTTNWATGQTVTVAAVGDTDATHERVTVTHAVGAGSAAEYLTTGAVRFTVRVADGNAGLSVRPRAVTVTEGGTGVPYTLALSTAPTGPVTVAVAVAGTPALVAAVPAALTFTTGNWNTARAVTVTPTSAADDIDGVDPAAVTVSHTAASSDASYTITTARTTEQVTVTIEDDETPGVRVSPLRLTVQEDPTAGGGTNRHVGTYTLELTSGISGDDATEAVGIRVTSSNRDAVQVQTGWDPFTPGSGQWRVIFQPSNWNVPRTVTVLAQSDSDGRDETVTVNNEYFAFDGDVTDQGYNQFNDPPPSPHNVTVTVVDDEEPALVVDTAPGTAGVQTGALEVREGSTATAAYTLALGVVPTGAVTVTVGNGDATAVTLAPAALTFSTTTWATAQTVVATPAANDADGEHERVTVTHTLTGAEEYIPPALPAASVPTVTVNVTDDDAASARIYTSVPAALVQHALDGARVGIEVTNTTWASGVATTAAVGDYFALDTAVPGLRLDRIYSVPSTRTVQLALAYDGSDFDTAQTLTVRVLAAAHTGSDVLATGTRTVEPTRGVEASVAAVTVVEEATATYTLRLTSPPTGAVTVSVASSDNPDVTVAPAVLTFTGGAGGNWNTAQAVTVSAADDGDGADETATLAHTAAAGSQDPGYTFATARTRENVAVTVTDNDAPGLAVDPTTLMLTEQDATAGSGTYTVALATAPSGLVTLTATSGDAAVTVAPTALTYGATTWNTAQTVTATAVDDADDDGETVTVTHAVSGTADATSYPTTLDLTAANVTVTVTDNDTPGLVVSATALTANGVNEGATATYTVALTVLPTGPVTVTVSSDNADVPADVDGDAGNGAQATLTYSTTTWNTAQTVTVRAADDDDAVDDAVTWTHDPSGANYDSVTNVALAFTVNDDDTRAVVVDTDLVTPGLQTTALAVTEEHATLGRAAYTVALGTQPVGGAVTVTITSDGQAVAEPAQLVFTANDWATARTVAAVARPDDDGNNASVTLTHTAGGADYPAPPAAVTADVTVTVTDDDQPGLWVSTTTLAVAEPGTGTYTVRLNTEPGGAVTVGVADTTSNADVSVGPSALEFSAADWNTAQAVTVTVTADADAADDTATLRHTVTGTADTTSYPTTLSLTAADVTVTVADPDTAAVTVSATALALLETGPGSGTYTVVLGTEPTAAVTVTIASDDAGAVSRAPAALTFSATDWNTAQAVTATAVADADAVDERVTVTHTLTGAAEYAGSAGPPAVAGVTVGAVAVTVEDDEEQGLTLTQPAVTVAEDGAAGTYTVVLDSEPTASVVVRIGSDNTDVHARPGLLQYTASNWNTAQTVTVRADADADARADMATLTHTAAGGDYTGLAEQSVPVTVTDNDAGVEVSRRALTVVVGSTNTYTVVLAAQPAGPVTVTVSSSAVGTAAVDTDATPESRALVFSAGNWQTPQVVTVTGVTAPGGPPVSLTHLVSGYGSVVSAASVRVTVVGPGTGFLRIVPQAVTVLEGTSGTYTVGLGTEPTRAVTVTVGAPSNTNSAITRAPGALTFDATSWATAQAVTVTAGTDAGTTEGMATIAHTVTGYGSVTSVPDVTVTEDEDETPTLGAVAAQTYREWQPVNVRLPGATGGNPPRRYALTGGTPPPLTLPAGLTFDATTRRLQGTPRAAAAAATYTYTVTDADGDAATPPRTFTLTVEPNPNRLRFEATVASQTYPLNRAVDPPLSLPAPRGSTNRSLTFYLKPPPELPDGLTYVPPRPEEVEGARVYLSGGQIVGTPTEARRGRYRLVVVDAVSGEEDELTFELETGTSSSEPGPGPEPTFGDATVEAQRYTVGTAVTLTLPAATGGDGRLTYTLTPADVPAGLTYTPPAAAAVTGGTLTGTPTAVRAETTYTLTATDADGDTATLAFTVEVGAADTAPTFGEQTVADQTYTVGTAIPLLTLPAATGGDGRLTYTLTGPAGADPPAGLRYTPPPVEEPHGGTLSGTPTEAQAVTPYTLTATDADGDAATLTFTIAVVRTPVRVTLADASAVEGRPVEFAVTLSRAVSTPLTLAWTAGRPGSATPGEDYEAVAAGQVTVAAGATAGTLVVRTLDDRRVEPVETFTVTVTLPADTSIELAKGTAAGRIEDDDTEQARRRSLGMVLAGVGRTLATDAVDVIGDRFVRPPTAAQATVGGQAVDLERGPQRGRWRHAAGVAYGVARALGVEVGSPLEGGDGPFGQVRGAAWSTLTRHLRNPHAPTPPLSAWDAPGAFAAPPGPGWDGPSAGWGNPHATGEAPSIPPPSGKGLELAPDSIRGGGFSVGQSPASGLPFGHAALPGLAGYSNGLGQLGFDRAHAATPQAVQVGAFRAPVQFRRVSGAEVLSQSAFELPLSRPAPRAVASATEGTPAAGPPIDPAAQAAAATWTLWGRGTASGFNGKPKADFSMDGNVFTGYLGVDYRLQPNVLLGLAVAHSQGDVDYETADVTKGAVDVTLTSLLPYAHWSPRPGLGVWGLFGAGWGDLKLRDEAGKVKTDLELLLGAVGARQEVLTWRRIDVALKADAFLTELEAGSDDRLPETAGDAQRLRLMVEGRTAWALSEDSHLTPVFEVGGRWDGGKAETGVGAEMGGGFEYAHTQLGLGIEARGRYLLAHQKSAFDAWGASLTLRLDPGADKRGLWLALAPVWGAEASQVEQMWGSADVLRANGETDTQPGFSPAQVEFDVGYGMVTHEGAGLLTTYGGLSMLGPESHGVRLGGRLALGTWIDLSLEGERTTQGGGAEHQVALYGHLGW